MVGLNFDYVAYNITGFVAYGAFNAALFWAPYIQQLYYDDHPFGVIPVMANDVAFTLHAILCTVIIMVQCAIYERDHQRVSYTCRAILAAMWLFVFISLIVAGAGSITWLQYLYFFSYVKLAVTLIKYIPQAWMNYRRQSTVGWSIGNVLLDFTGGILSIAQMFIISYNNGAARKCSAPAGARDLSIARRR